MNDLERTFFHNITNIDQLLEYISEKSVEFNKEEEIILNKIIYCLNEIKGSEKEKEFVDLMHYVEDKISITSTKYQRLNFKKNFFTIGSIARAFVYDYDKFMMYTKWQQALLSLFYNEREENINYNLFTCDIMDILVGKDGPTDEEIKKDREEVFSQVYKTNYCQKKQVKFLLDDGINIDVNRFYDIVGYPPKNKNKLTKEEIDKATELLLLRGPEESIVSRKVYLLSNLMNDVEIMSLDMSYDELLEYIKTHSIAEIQENGSEKFLRSFIKE